MLTHIVRHLFRTARPTNFKLGTRMEDDDAHHRRRMASTVKDQGHTRPINGDRHRALYLLNGKAYELQTRYTDGGRRPASATGAMTSKVKVAGSRGQSYPSWPNAVPVSLEAGRGIPCRPNPEAILLIGS